MRVRDSSLKFEIVVDIKYGRQIPIKIVCCIPRRKEKDIDIKLDLAGNTNVPDNTDF